MEILLMHIVSLIIRDFFYLVLADEFKSDMSPQDKSLSNVLLWAILANRKELAAMFWLKGNDQLCKVFFPVKAIVQFQYQIFYEIK